MKSLNPLFINSQESQLHLLEFLGGFFRDLLGRELAAPTSPPVTRRYTSTISLGSNFSNFLAVSCAMYSPIFLGARELAAPVTRMYTSKIWLGSSFGGIAVLRRLMRFLLLDRGCALKMCFWRRLKTKLGFMEMVETTNSPLDIYGPDKSDLYGLLVRSCTNYIIGSVTV